MCMQMHKEMRPPIGKPGRYDKDGLPSAPHQPAMDDTTPLLRGNPEGARKHQSRLFSLNFLHKHLGHSDRKNISYNVVVFDKMGGIE